MASIQIMIDFQVSNELPINYRVISGSHGHPQGTTRAHDHDFVLAQATREFVQFEFINERRMPYKALRKEETHLGSNDC